MSGFLQTVAKYIILIIIFFAAIAQFVNSEYAPDIAIFVMVIVVIGLIQRLFERNPDSS